MVGEFDPQRPGELVDTCLAGRVGRVERAVDERVDRRDDEDVAAPLDHRRQCGADRAPLAEQVDVDGPLEFAGIDGQDRLRGRGDAGVGDHDVDAAEPGDRGVGGALQRVQVAHVGLERGRALAELGGQLLQWFQPPADQSYPRAARVGLAGDLGADAAGRAGDEHDTTVQLEARRGAEHAPGDGQRSCSAHSRGTERAGGVLERGARCRDVIDGVSHFLLLCGWVCEITDPCPWR